MCEISRMLNFISIESQVTEVKRIGPYQEGKIRTIVFTVAIKLHRQLILLSISKLKDFDILLFVNKKHNAEEAKLERSMLRL